MRCCRFILLTFLWFSLTVHSQSFADTNIISVPSRVVIITNRDVTEVIDNNVVRSIALLNRRFWRDGVPIRLVVLTENHKLHVGFVSQNVGIQPYQLDRAWQRRIYAGLAEPPIRVDSVEKMLAVVRQTRGAIGYVDLNMDLSSKDVRSWP